MKTRGPGITISGGLTSINNYKTIMSKVSEGVAVKEWQPLTSWPVARDRNDARRAEYAAMPSRWT